MRDAQVPITVLPRGIPNILPELLDICVSFGASWPEKNGYRLSAITHQLSVIMIDREEKDLYLSMVVVCMYCGATTGFHHDGYHHPSTNKFMVDCGCDTWNLGDTVY